MTKIPKAVGVKSEPKEHPQVRLYRMMTRIRVFETCAQNLWNHRTGPGPNAEVTEARHMPGFVHLSIGQEAVAVGVCTLLGEKDQIASTHRGHGHVIAKGGDLNLLMAELYGRVTGYCRGRVDLCTSMLRKLVYWVLTESWQVESHMLSEQHFHQNS